MKNNSKDYKQDIVISKKGESLLKSPAFRFRMGQEIFRSLEHAKPNARFPKWLWEKAIKLLSFAKDLDKTL